MSVVKPVLFAEWPVLLLQSVCSVAGKLSWLFRGELAPLP